MTERRFRLILGLALLTALYAESAAAVWGLIGVLLFEGVTGWRVPLRVSRLRTAVATAPCARCRFEFHAERMLRLVVVTAHPHHRLCRLARHIVVFPLVNRHYPGRRRRHQYLPHGNGASVVGP